jgi:hypothetical protein
METFTLVVYLGLVGEPWSWDYREARTPGLSEGSCKAAARLVQPPQGRAWCFIEGRPEPVWSRPPSVEPPGPCAACGEIPGRKPAQMVTFTLIISECGGIPGQKPT